MTASPVLRATRRITNGHLIGDCARLGYIRKSSSTVDLTYGDGVWWSQFTPRRLVKHDLILDGVDFRNLPEDDDTYDVAAYDPPYVSIGGRETSKIKAFYNQYGLLDAPTSPESLQRLINGGLDSAYRVLKPKSRGYKGGIALVKCSDYISSGRLWLGVHWTLEHAMSIGFEPIDILLMITEPGRQPERTRAGPNGTRIKSKQAHARSNVSTLLVLQKRNFRVDSVRRRIEP